MARSALVVGLGFAGAVCAERLASAGWRVHAIDRRPHIAGNAFDERDAHGLLIHRYGPHIFHTNSKKIFEYLSAFTAWRFYEHRVLAEVDGQRVPIPINRTTLNKVYGLDLDEAGAAAYLESVREPRESVRTSEDVVVGSVGHDLCDKFFRGYTRKQWGLDLSELAAGVAARIPTRTNDDDRYFTDSFQFMPADGFTAMFARLLAHPDITVEVGRSFPDGFDLGSYDHIVYTGPIDAYFGYRHGALPYRSLRFDHAHEPDVEFIQEVTTVNFPNTHDYTRITEFKRMTGDKGRGSSYVKEYPQASGDPYYPIPRRENEELYQKYKELADAEPNVTFVGRLAQYRYYNMDQVVGAALTAAERIVGAR